MLDYRLHVFRTVAEKLHFTHAAAELHISQPAVTQHVKALEESYEVALFHRSGGRISLTEAGQILLDHANQVHALDRDVETRIRAGQPQLRGPLRLGASSTIGQYLLPRIMAAFRGKHPQVELSLEIGNTEDITAAILSRRIDLALVEGIGKCRRDLVSELRMEDEIICVAAPDHPLAINRSLTPADLVDVDIIAREVGSGTREVVARALKSAGLPPTKMRVVMESSSSESIKGFIAGGMGIGFVPRLAITHELALGTLLELPIRGLAITRPFRFLYPQGPRPVGLPGAFLDFAEKTVAK